MIQMSPDNTTKPTQHSLLKCDLFDSVSEFTSQKDVKFENEKSLKNSVTTYFHSMHSFHMFIHCSYKNINHKRTQIFEFFLKCKYIFFLNKWINTRKYKYNSSRNSCPAQRYFSTVVKGVESSHPVNVVSHLVIVIP